jgi:hypothetical protein
MIALHTADTPNGHKIGIWPAAAGQRGAPQRGAAVARVIERASAGALIIAGVAGLKFLTR